jgi:hypothetical protein
MYIRVEGWHASTTPCRISPSALAPAQREFSAWLMPLVGYMQRGHLPTHLPTLTACTTLSVVYQWEWAVHA